jgi:hypothetical protein
MRLVAAALLTAGLVATANAAESDPIGEIWLPTAAPPPLLAGFYIGVNAAGYNLVKNRFLVGVDARATNPVDSGRVVGLEIDVGLRLGIVLADRVLLYAGGGVGTIGFTHFTHEVGGGVEISLGEVISVFFDAGFTGEFGGPCCEVEVQIGVHRHP